MNSIPASEVKRRGVAALRGGCEERGPVHATENNRPTLVVLSEEVVRFSTGRSVGEPEALALQERVGFSAPRAVGADSYEEQIDADLREERASWGDR